MKAKIRGLLVQYGAAAIAAFLAIVALFSLRSARRDVCHANGLPEHAWILADGDSPVFSQDAPRIIALTFDDGPHGVYTEQILDYLKQENVRATFFVLGSKARRNQSLIKRMNDEGHEIGNHGYDHTRFTRLTDGALKKQLAQTDRIIRGITGKAPVIVRPPGGEVSSRVKAAVDRPLIFWTIDPRDWETLDAEAVADDVIEHAKPGGIILLHDIREHTVRAVKKIVPALKEKSYAFVTIDALLVAYGKASKGHAD